VQANFFAGTYLFPDEVMFEGNLSELADLNSKINKIRACYLCDIDYQSSEYADTIELTLFFTIETLLDYQCNKSQSYETTFKNITCKKKLLLSKNQFAEHFTEMNTKKFFIHHLSNTFFVTQSLDNGDELLTVSATIEGIILLEYHYNFWICNELDLQPPTKLKTYDWKDILENINIGDTIVLFENLLTLIKGLSYDKLDNQIIQPDVIMDNKPRAPTITSANTGINREQNEFNNKILELKNELHNRDYIINGLLKCLCNTPPFSTG
jgi:hypothetical protein